MHPFDSKKSTTPDSRQNPITPTARLPRNSEYLKAPTFFTPKTTKPVPPRSRPPLRVRDNNQNAPSLNPKPAITTTHTSTTRSTVARASSSRTMPVGGGDNNRPRQPQLSAAAARAGNRPPLTPKVAAGKQQQPSVSPIPPKRPQQHQEDSATPVAPFLANITPRTGSRQSRVDSANSTPNGTPNPDKNFDGWGDAGKTGLGVSTLSLDAAKPNAPADQQQDSAESKFFYARDARPGSQGSTQRPPFVPQKPTTFFYANGSSPEGKRTASPPSNPSFTPVLTSTPEPASTKFFYANGTPDHPSRPGLTSASGSTVSSSSRMAPTRPGTGTPATAPGASVTSRPMSPIKVASTPSNTSSLQGSAMPPGPTNRPIGASPPTLAPAPNISGKRRVSIEAPAREGPPAGGGHARAGSVPTLEQLTVPKYARSPQSPEAASASPPLSPGLSRPAMTMASLLQAADDLQGGEETGDDDAQPEAPSPTKSVHSTDAVSELVANARRERKVQDLEITNASLEAINRTLERQLRKQTAELRRYRRLSRSGRFSMASGASSRVTSAAMTEPPVDLSDHGEEDQTEGEDLDSLHESDLSSDEAGSNEDPTSPNAKMAARRKRDEIRLQLDLTKHQELLFDSQKMNQSIKRCLDWTEVLIKEGHRALEYHVRVSDVELGGHVLAPPDDDDDDDRASGQEDSMAKDPTSTLEPPWGKTLDRDSGVELPVDGG